MATAVVMLMPFSRSTMVRWENPPDSLAAFADVREQLEDTGWVEVEGLSGAGAGVEDPSRTSPETERFSSVADATDQDKSQASGGSKTVFQKGSITRTLVLFTGRGRTDLLLTEELSEVEEGATQEE
jgi:hypothetical protein